MNSKILRISLIGLFILFLLLNAFLGGMVVGLSSDQFMTQNIPDSLGFLKTLLPPVPGVETAPNGTDEGQELDALFKPFWESWQIVNEQYVTQPLEKEKLMQGAIRGMLQSLDDPYTSYMDPFQYQQNTASLEGDYEGIGAWVDITGEYLAIISPMPGSPAEKAGLKAGDIVVAIDGEDMTGIPGDLVLRRILGPAGSEVVLSVQREDSSEPLEFKIIRENIVIPSLEAKMLDNNIGYIRLYTFGEDTGKDLSKELSTLMKSNPNGLVLDLRNNSGGYLTTAVDVVSEFIDAGKIVLYQEYGDGSRQTWETNRGGKALDIPLVVLVNEGTASASEITAGAIQDYERGTLVGTTTFGKGLVQNWIPLRNDNGAVSITTAHWLTPDERQIHKLGLTPDVVVEITDEDIEAEKDPQLEKAIDLLLNR
jgi:carboxyl-terminal processing protease